MNNIRTLPTKSERFDHDANACADEINALMNRLSDRYGSFAACAGLTRITGVMLNKFRDCSRQSLADSWKHLRSASRGHP
jgi:hypothetical protein